MRILIVEDHALLAMALEMCLESGGHDVIGLASSAGEALSLAEQMRPNLALVDINLRDGYTGASLVRDLSSRLGVRSLFLSAQRHEAHCNRDAALGLISKPYDPETVLQIIDVANRLVSGAALPHRLPSGVELFAEAGACTVDQ